MAGGSYFGAPDKSGQHGVQGGGGKSFSASAKWNGKAVSPKGAGNRHTRIDRGAGATAMNPAGHIKAVKGSGGLRSGPARGV